MFWIKAVFCAAFLAAGFTTAYAQETAGASLSSGTGFFVNEIGWLVTNAHVVKGCTAIDIVGHGRSDRVLVDDSKDLAAIHVTTNSRTVPLTFYPADSRLGQEVVSLGYPLADFLSRSVKVTFGNISSLAGPLDDGTLVQHTATIQPGNSGGPLLDMSGRVVGVNNAILKRELGTNINFGIKSLVAVSFLRSRGIEFTEDSSRTEFQKVEEVVTSAAQSTVQVLCLGGQIVSTGPDAASPGPGGCNGAANWHLSLYVNLDFWGGDIFPKGVEARTVDECAQKCSESSECRAFTFNEKRHSCYPKRQIEVPVVTEGVVSALLFEDLSGSTQVRGKNIVAEFRAYPSNAFSFFRNPRYQPPMMIRSIDQCVRFCSSSRSCNYLTWDSDENGRRSCSVWRDIPGSLRSKRTSTSFERINESIAPEATISLCDGAVTR